MGLKKMTYFYMCVRVNAYKPENHGCPSFHTSFFDANRYAQKYAKTWIANIPIVGIINERVTMCVYIFKIPFGVDVPLYDPKFSNIADDEMFFYYHYKTIWDRETSAARLIQNIYRSRFKSRVESATLIQKYYRKAISCPYIQLCKNRLMREFNEMKN